MMPHAIQRQYDEVIAPHYDLDPQSVTGASLDRAAAQILRQQLFDNETEPLRVLDVGVGTGLFLEKLKALGGARVQPFGLDLSEKMIERAFTKIPGLVAAVDDAANLDVHFPDQSFDLICTHFVSGFVPLSVLAPKIKSRLADGGYWSLVAGTKAGFPALQAKGNSKILRWLMGGGIDPLVVDDFVCNPADRAEVIQTLESNGFAIQQFDSFEPELDFRDLDEFMNFAYRGGWLTPFVEALGLDRAGAMTRLMINLLFFPIEDHHNIEIVLAKKRGG